MKVYLDNQPYLVTKVFYDDLGNRYIGVKSIPSYEYKMTRMHISFGKKAGAFFKGMFKTKGARDIARKSRQSIIKSKIPVGIKAPLSMKPPKVTVQGPQTKIPKPINPTIPKNTAKKTTAAQKYMQKQREMYMKQAEKGKEILRRTGNVMMGKNRWNKFHKNPSLSTGANLVGGGIKRAVGATAIAGGVATAGALYATKKIGNAGMSAGRQAVNHIRPMARNLNRAYDE